jgi:hypothetical protein
LLSLHEIWQIGSARHRYGYCIDFTTNRLHFPHHRLTMSLKLHHGQSIELMSLAPVGIRVCGHDIHHSANVFNIQPRSFNAAL